MSEDEQRIHDWLMARAPHFRREFGSAMRTIARDIAIGRHHFPADPAAEARLARSRLFRERGAPA